MKKTLFKIGEMAEINHISTQTLRLYDKIKLLQPEYLDQNTKYRYYTLEQCAKLGLIQALKGCKLPLSRIKEIFELSSQEILLDILEEQTKNISDELYNLSVSRNSLFRIRQNIQMINTLPGYGKIFFEYCEESRIEVQKTKYDFFSQGYEGYENMLRYIQTYLHVNKLPLSYFINIGTLMSKEAFMSGNYTSNDAFFFVDELYPKTKTIRKIPAGTFMSLISDDTNLENQYAKQMYDEIQKNDMVPCGDYMCEVLTQFPLNEKRKLIYKIKIPVKRKTSL